MEIILGWLLLVGLMGGPYLYGCRVGLRAGKQIGRKQADAEWALHLEHGMVG